MQFSACITTRNRSQPLNACLKALWSSSRKPLLVVVSDDSPEETRRQTNAQIVQHYPDTVYLAGPQRGVCANRNHALKRALESQADWFAFIDDDICVEPDFIAAALERYRQLPPGQRQVLLSGVHRDDAIADSPFSKLSFRGYFCPSPVPEVVNLHAAVFPRSLLEVEQWDENLFFGYEDAELCLRALKQGYQILHCPELQVVDTCPKASTLKISGQDGLTDYEIYIEAARLYVGIKRYKDITPNPAKLLAFLSLYWVHMAVYLLRQRSLSAWSRILQSAHLGRLWMAKASAAGSQNQPGSNPLLQSRRET